MLVLRWPRHIKVLGGEAGLTSANRKIVIIATPKNHVTKSKTGRGQFIFKHGQCECECELGWEC